MYGLFIQEQRDNDRAECEDGLFRHIFHTEFNLKIGDRSLDTCDTCDQYKAQLKGGGTADQVRDIEEKLKLHHQISSDSYKSYQEDCARAKTDLKYVVLTGDLEQVIFTPGLNNSSSFYLRKLSNFNYGIHNSADNSATMNIWDETTGKRGSNEVTSCFWKYITLKYSTLADGEERELIVWLDRCRGQNNNYMFIVMLMVLVWTKYFTKVHQKFFCTGHSYNDCDRDFGLIEKQQRSHSILVPSDIEKIITAARVDNVFTTNAMKRINFKDFKFQSTLLRRPVTLKVTQHLWFSYEEKFPQQILTRTTHSPDVWHQHLLYDLTGELMVQIPEFNVNNLRFAHEHPIPLEEGKKRDIKKLMKFLSGEPLHFYEYLIFEQDRLFPDDEDDDA